MTWHAHGPTAQVCGRDVELKFISGGARTLLGPNALAGGSRGRVVCVNVHWRLSPDEDAALEALEAMLQR